MNGARRGRQCPGWSPSGLLINDVRAFSWIGVRLPCTGAAGDHRVPLLNMDDVGGMTTGLCRLLRRRRRGKLITRFDDFVIRALSPVIITGHVGGGGDDLTYAHQPLPNASRCL